MPEGLSAPGRAVAIGGAASQGRTDVAVVRLSPPRCPVVERRLFRHAVVRSVETGLRIRTEFDQSFAVRPRRGMPSAEPRHTFTQREPK